MGVSEEKRIHMGGGGGEQGENECIWGIKGKDGTNRGRGFKA